MLNSVFNDISYFMLLFLIFLFTFAMCMHVLVVDVAAYGRMPPLFGQFMSIFRASMGDMAMLDPYKSFDLYDGPNDMPFEEREFFLTKSIVIFTFFIYIIGQFFLFMIFMNFIIAVITESHNKII